MKKDALKYFTEILEGIERDGLKKNEKVITTPQGARVSLSDGRRVVNMCANNYLGLADRREAFLKKNWLNTAICVLFLKKEIRLQSM